MNMTKSKIKEMKEAFKPVVELYQSLTIEQCVELYLKQHDNLDYWQKRVVLSIIGAKTVYKDEYMPNWHKPVRKINKK